MLQLASVAFEMSAMLGALVFALQSIFKVLKKRQEMASLVPPYRKMKKYRSVNEEELCLTMPSRSISTDLHPHVVLIAFRLSVWVECWDFEFSNLLCSMWC